MSFQHLELTRDGDWPRTDARTRVLLTALNVPGYYSLPIRILALLSRGDADLEKRFDVRYVEFENNNDVDEIACMAVDWQVEILALSVNVWNRDQCFELAAKCKEHNSRIVILAGGQEVTNSVVDYLGEVRDIDYIIDGEGELPFKEFLKAWDPDSGNIDPSKVSGLRYRENNNTAFAGPANIVASLDEVPSPVLAGLVQADRNDKMGVMLEGARGCPNRCAFCFEGYRKCKVRTASMERIRQETEYMAARGSTYFHMMDPILCNSSLSRLKEFSDIVKDLVARNKKTYFSVEVYARHISEEVAECLDGAFILDIGLQSINPESQKAIRRPFSIERFQRGIENLRKTKSTWNYYLICGLPHETLLTFLRAVSFALGERPTRFFINELLLLNGTELRARAAEYGYVFDADPPYTMRASSWMSEREVKIAYALSRVVVKSYGFALRAFFPSAFWLPEKSGGKEEWLEIVLPTGCSGQCPECVQRRASSGDQWERISRVLAGASGRNVEIVAGDGVDMRTLSRLAAQLQLSGAARLKLTAPISLFTDMELTAEMVNMGIWHYKIALAPDGIGATGNLANLDRAFPLRGQSAIKPNVEVIIPVGAGTPAGVNELIRSAARHRPAVITIPVAENMGGEWAAVLAKAFDEALDAGYWLKLPPRIAEHALGNIDNCNEIVGHLEKLGLTSAKPDQPPCMRRSLDQAVQSAGKDKR
jgi:radical SAM superfamily enzyme YgiQ (UPF0313 family)